jgi:hypothetical protein
MRSHGNRFGIGAPVVALTGKLMPVAAAPFACPRPGIEGRARRRHRGVDLIRPEIATSAIGSSVCGEISPSAPDRCVTDQLSGLR